MDQNDLITERKVLSAMLNEGFTFSVYMKSPLKWFSKSKKRTFKITKQYLGTMDYLAEVNLAMAINNDALDGNPLHEKNVIIRDNNKPLTKAIAIAWLNNPITIKLFTPIMSFYFRWHLDSGLGMDVADIIDLIQDAGNFINSIRLLSGQTRTTSPKPAPIEEKQRA